MVKDRLTDAQTDSASEVTTLWRYRPTNMFIIIIFLYPR